MASANVSKSSQRTLGDTGPRTVRLAGIIGGLGLLLSALLGFFAGVDADHVWKSYLFGFLFILSISLGGLFFTILQHITRAGWSVTIRRIAEGLASNLLWIWVLFIPIVVANLAGWTHMYHWLHPGGDEVLLHKAPYFFWPLGHESHVPAFWLLRAIAFFAIWAMLARFFVNNSIAQDSSGDVKLTSQMQWYAPISMLLYALTQSFAAFDWVMSLEPHWFSTIFPVYFFAASACGFFATAILIAFLLQRSGRVEKEITLEHYQDLGKMLFAFGVVFWAYIGFSQFMLQWYANLPETTGWFIARSIGGWGMVTALLVFGHFVLPFLALISKHPKRAKFILAALAGWMVLMHAVDLYWLTMPVIPMDILHDAPTMDVLRAQVNSADVNFAPHLIDLTFVLGMAGLLAAGTARRLSQCSLIPEHDPRLHEALAFENM